MCAYQRIDALSALESGIGEKAFRNHHAALLPGMKNRVKHHFAAMIADFDPVAIGDAQCLGIVWVNEKLRPDFLCRGGGCFGKGGIQEIMRRRRGEAERVLSIRRLDHFPMIGKFRDRLIWPL